MLCRVVGIVVAHLPPIPMVGCKPPVQAPATVAMPLARKLPAVALPHLPQQALHGPAHLRRPQAGIAPKPFEFVVR